MPNTVDLRGKRVLVVGLARTGVATAVFCATRGALVTATDIQAEGELGQMVPQLRGAGVRVMLGGHQEKDILQQDFIIPSPGVPADSPFILAARKKNITVWSEVELAYRFLRGILIGITGSNGKTTTTSLIAHIIDRAELPVLLAGNIGVPIISCVDRMMHSTITVAELSSFQLELVESFRPNISVFLNLTPDHLDRHRTLKAYGAAKARIFKNQLPEDAAVLNADDPALVPYVPERPGVFWFSRKNKVKQGAYLEGEEIVFRDNDVNEFIMLRGEIPLVGAHNLENVLAAVAAARLAGVDAYAIANGVRSFAGVEHRLEFVAEIRGVRYYNDSKATNVDATLKALDAFSGGVFVILGGKDKGSDYTVLQGPLREKAILALLIGEAAEKIETQIGDSVAIEHAETLQNAVEIASQTAQPGDVVVLAPACASFDQFQDYEHRGRVFKELVNQLKEHSTGASSG